MPIQPPRIPAAFDVLVKELKGLALDVDLVAPKIVYATDDEDGSGHVKADDADLSERGGARIR